MDILNPRSLREDARRALARGRDPQKLIYSYAGISLGLSLLLALVDLWLEKEISGTGGLSNLGTRAIFSTAQQAIPLLLSLLTMCLELGYLSGMLRISRGQYADHTDLKVGLEKFWPLMRLTVLQGMIYLGLAFFALQLGGVIFALTPWAEPMAEAATVIASGDPAALTEAFLLDLIDQMAPGYVICGIVYLLLLIPFLYRLRFSHYCLLDDSNGQALAAIRTSSKLMRRHLLDMLKIDLSLWPYHAGRVLVLLTLFGDVIAMLLGIRIPLDSELLLPVINGTAALLQFVVYVTLRNKAEAVYITAYDRLREKPKEGGPVVLGNIFDM